MYGVPLDLCARSMHEALTSFETSATSLKHVMLVDLGMEGAGMIAIIFQQLAALQHDTSMAEEQTEVARSFEPIRAEEIGRASCRERV